MDIWRGVFTMNGVGPLILFVIFVIIFAFVHPGKKDLLLGGLSALSSLLVLGAFAGYPSTGTSVSITLFWTAAAIFMARRPLLGLLVLFLPPATITLVALLFGKTSFGYGVFVLVVSLLSSLIVLALLFVFYRILRRIINT